MAFVLSATPTAGTGTISISANSTTVTGIGTNFTGQALNGKIILLNGHNALVTAVASATSMTINRAPTFAVSGVAFSFVNNGTRIDQTGTDANPSGIAAILGVFNNVQGTAPAIQTIDIGSLMLYIQGTLTIPDTYWLAATGGSAGNSLTVGTTGKLVIDGRYTLTRNDGTSPVLYSRACGILIRKPSGVPYSVNTIQFDSGSQFEQYGGIVECSGAIRWLTTTTSIATITQAVWYVLDRSNQGFMNVYFNLSKINIDGLTIYSNGVAYPGFLKTLDAGYSIKGFAVKGGLAGVSAIDGTTALIRLDGFFGGESKFDFLMRNGGIAVGEGTVGGYDFYDANLGNNLLVGPNGTASENYGRSRHYLSYTPTFLDATTSAGIVGMVLYQKDANNGTRVTTNGVTADKVYINESIADGAFPLISLLTKVWSGTGALTINQDNRLPIKGYAWGYNHIGTPVNIVSSIGPQTPTLYAPTDVNVTLERIAANAKLLSSFSVDRTNNIVSWSSVASTLDDWYDAMKAYKCSTTQAQIEYPTLANQIVTASGNAVVTSIQQTINVAQTQGAKFKDLQGSKPWLIASGGSSTFNRGTIVWNPATYADQIRVQSGGTLNLTNGTLMTVNPTVGLGYGTAATAMFRSGSILNMSDSTVVYNIVSGGAGTFFSNSEAGSTWNISNSIITLNCPNNAQVAIHAYFLPTSVINGLTVNGTASNVVWQMGYTTNNSKMVGFKYGGAIFGNGTSNILMDTYTYTGTDPNGIPSNFGSHNKWWWVDPVMQNNGVFRYFAGSTPTSNSGFYGVIGFRPTITMDKVGYAPKARIKGSALTTRYPSKTFNTTAFGTVPLSEFFRDPTFMSASDGFLPFIDSLDDKTVLNQINWSLEFRQAGFLDQSTTLLAATAKKGNVAYTASGVVDTNYVNASTGLADSALINVNTTTKTIAPVSGNLSWSPQRLYNALKNWWATYASDGDFLALTGNSALDLGDYSVSSTLRFAASAPGDMLTTVKTTGLINAATNDISVTDANGTSTILIITTPIDGYSLCIYKPDSTTKYFASNLVADSYVIYFNTTETGNYTFAAENYGNRRVEEDLTITGGMIGTTIQDTDDIGITEFNKTVVAAYTNIENSTKFYDATAYYRLSEAGIKKGQVATRNGTQIDISGFNHVIKDDASAVYNITGNTITTKAASYEGTEKYTKEVTNTPNTITPFDTEIITILIEDANGDSTAVLEGTVNNMVEVWKIPNSTLPKNFSTGVLLDTGIGNGPYRFAHQDGYQLVFNNTDLGIVFRYCSMSKGDYQLGWYIYNSATGGLTDQQADILYSMYNKNIIIQENTETTNSKLDTNLDAKVSTRLAAADYIAPDNAKIVAIDAKVATLENYNDTTLQSKVDAVQVTVNDLENYDDTILQGKADDIKAKTDILENYNDATVQSKLDGLATDLDSVALESTAQAIKAKTDTLVNYDDATAQTKLDAIKAKTDVLVNTDLTGIALESTSQAIKTKVDSLNNTDLTGIALESTLQEVKTDVKNIAVDFTPVINAVNTRLAAADYVAPDNASIEETKDMVALLENTDLTPVLDAVAETVKTDDPRLDNLDATISSRSTLEEIESSTILAKEATVVALYSPPVEEEPVPGISITSVDPTGHLITLKNKIGAYPVANVAKIIFEVSKRNSTEKHTVSQQLSPANQDLPVLSEILTGKDVVLNSKVLGITTAEEGLEAFSDGVTEVVAHVVFNASKSATGVADQKFITGTGLDIYSGYEHILVGEDMYKIDHALGTNGGTVMYLTSPLKTAVTSFLPVESTSDKVLVDAAAQKYLISNIGSMANASCKCSSTTSKSQSLAKILMWKVAAEEAFSVKDFNGADKLLSNIPAYSKKGCSC